MINAKYIISANLFSRCPIRLHSEGHASLHVHPTHATPSHATLPRSYAVRRDGRQRYCVSHPRHSSPCNPFPVPLPHSHSPPTSVGSGTLQAFAALIACIAASQASLHAPPPTPHLTLRPLPSSFADRRDGPRYACWFALVGASCRRRLASYPSHPILTQTSSSPLSLPPPST
jgi:hypothetical protein